jgi:hypothetical protein
MAGTKESKSEFQENPFVAELIAAGAENARVLRGFIGPSRDADHITLYQNLAQLGDTVEIPRDDVLHTGEIPGSVLGAVILWVKEGARLGVRTTQSEAHPATGPGSLREVSKGRLRMQPRPGMRADVCTSRCNVCVSECYCPMPDCYAR